MLPISKICSSLPKIEWIGDVFIFKEAVKQVQNVVLKVSGRHRVYILGQFSSLIGFLLSENDLSRVGGFFDNGACSWLLKR